jgi:putative phosphoesterase
MAGFEVYLNGRFWVSPEVHGNLEALEAIAEPCDELWVLGDLVNYGPNPSEVVDYIRRNATVVVSGNHDHAIGYGVDPQCSAPFRPMAQAMQVYTESILNDEQKAFLRELPLTAERTVDGQRLLLCHAVPSDPLYRYCAPDSPAWEVEARRVDADVILVGHTHLPFLATLDNRQIVNPGSVGQTKHGFSRACYAVWEDGRFLLESQPYDTAKTVRKVLALPISEGIAGQLADGLIRGAAPP